MATAMPANAADTGEDKASSNIRENNMSITLIDQESHCRLVFEGSLTFEFARELEDRIIDALRRYTSFELDLSGIREIDLCGIHLLGVLDAFAGKTTRIVGRSPLVEQAKCRLLTSQRGSCLRGTRDERAQAGCSPRAC